MLLVIILDFELIGCIFFADGILLPSASRFSFTRYAGCMY